LTSVAASPVYVVAYDSNNNVVATAGPAPNDYATGHMTELKITRAVPDMAYVIVHDTGNFFLADSLCTDAPGVVEALPPPIIDVNAFNGFAGVDADLQATIIEPVSNVLASDYAVTVNWGDGTSDSSGVGINPPGTRSDGEPLCPSGDTCRLLTDIHTYSAPGSYVVTVTVARTAGGQTVSAQGQGIATIVTSNATATIRSVGLLTFSEVGQTDVYSGQPIVSGCTATVVDSPSGNVILTAKHCLGETFGDVANLEFAPFHRPNNPCWNDIAAAHPYQVQVAECGGNPFGVWYAQPIDITKGAGDYAFVVVHPSPGEPSVEQAAGGVPVVFDLNGQPDPEQSQGWNFYMYPADQLNFAMKHQFRLLTCAGNPAGTPATSELQIESNCGYPPKLCATATRPCPFGGSGGPWVNTSNGIYTNNGGPLITGIGAVLKANVPEFGACNGCYGSVGTILGYDAMKTYERAALHGS
jgi:hypothetical protein